MSAGAAGGGDATQPQEAPPPLAARPPAAWLESVGAGFIAGSANVVAGHPFDTVKVVLQAGPSGPGQHAGALDATRHILRQGGVRGLYRGVASPLVGGALETAVNYSVYNAARRRLADGGGRPRFGQALDCLASGALAGVALSAVLGPAELVKCRVQAGGDAGVRAAVARIFRENGLPGFARGLGATLAREVPGNAIFFASYEALQRSAPASVSPGASAVLCGGVSGMVYWAVVLPIDTAKTRLQVATPRAGAPDLGLLQHLREVHALRGFRRGLYAGAGPVMVRAFVANAVQWAVWDALITRIHSAAG